MPGMDGFCFDIVMVCLPYLLMDFACGAKLLIL
jgi:hypothetical protein